MRKYSFRLETVRRVRRTQENVAKSALLVANTEVKRAIEVVQARSADYESSLSSSSVLGLTGVDRFMTQRYFNELAGQAVVAARAAQNAAEVEADAKRQVFTEVARKVKALDRLDERAREVHRIETGRATDAEIDEIVTGRFARPVTGAGIARPVTATGTGAA